MMEGKNLNDKLDELIKSAIPTIKANLIDDSDEAPDVITSNKHDEKMKEIFELAKRMEKDPEGTAKEYEEMVASYENMNKEENSSDIQEGNDTTPSNVRYISTHKKYKKFIVSLIAATLVIGLVGVVGASKIDLVKALFEDKTEYSEVNDNNFVASEAEFDNVRLKGIPKGYKYVETKDTSSSERRIFKNIEEGKYFAYEVKEYFWSGRIDTEDSSIEEITIGNKLGAYTIKDGIEMISWKENDLTECVVFGDCGRNILENVAKNVEFIKDVSPIEN